MNKYVLLFHPGSNQKYYEAAKNMAMAELEVILNQLKVEVIYIKKGYSGLEESLYFETKDEIEEETITLLSTFSLYYVLFKEQDKGGLIPLIANDFRYYPENMVKLLKYSGKTNEQFTRLMLNLAKGYCNTLSDKKVLLDPMCGKGTTLYEGFIRGIDVIGIEKNNRWYQETTQYIERFLKEGRYKHKVISGKRNDPNGKKIADVCLVKAGFTKERFKENNIDTIEVFHSDAQKANLLIKKRSVDMIVCDLPYGVLHASKQENIKSRKPVDLLYEALPTWYLVMKQGSSMVLSFNTHTLSFDKAILALEDNGFEVINRNQKDQYSHRVDQAIIRNLVIAKKI